jgi:hypothetical protein
VVPAPNQNIENNPMQSSLPSPAWMLERSERKHFDTSGKSPALFHHHAICRTPMVLPDNGLSSARFQYWGANAERILHESATRQGIGPRIGKLRGCVIMRFAF